MPSALFTSLLTLSISSGAGYSISWFIGGISLYSRNETLALSDISSLARRANFLLKDSFLMDPTIINIRLIFCLARYKAYFASYSTNIRVRMRGEKRRLSKHYYWPIENRYQSTGVGMF